MTGLLPLRIGRHVYLLGTYSFNTYLVCGEQAVLVEGAVSAQVPLLLRQLKFLGVDMREINHLVALHSHADHLMAFPPLRERFPWMRVAAHRFADKPFRDPRVQEKFHEADVHFAASLASAGLVEETTYGRRDGTYPLDLPLGEGDSLDLGNGIRLHVLETPGHAPDSISLYLEREGILFVSDAVGLWYPRGDIRPNHFYDLGMYEGSLRRIRSLRPRVLCKGHQGVIIGEKAVKDYVDLALAGVEHFKDFVRAHSDAAGREDLLRETTLDDFLVGVLAMFPLENNINLWKLMIRRTLEYLDRVPTGDGASS